MSTPLRWLTVGASPENDIRVDAPQVSGRHARIAAQPDGRIVVEDLGSTNGLWYQGRRVAQVVVRPNESVGLGQLELRLDALLATLTSRRASGPTHPGAGAGVTDLPAREVEVRDRPLVIGRERDCDIVLNDEAVSSRHARVFRNSGRLILEDLGSRNGTHVRRHDSGQWSSYRSVVLGPGDTVRVGGHAFRFRDAVRTQRSGTRLDVQRLDLVVPHRSTGEPVRLLSGVSFTVLAGEVVGILGPSGSGKTSLLNVLAGFDAPTGGQVLLQGQPLHDGARLRPGMGAVVGHAPQFDVAHELLTVEEAVRYSALLRGPPGWTTADVESRVTWALEAVGMADRRTTPLGSETRKTLSGGQKKRVNIAMELVLDPPLLLLDEPTSGLSSHDTIELMALLRRLADEGRTIVLTIHQPNYAAFIKMDQVLLLEEGGHVAWYGPAAIDTFEHLGVTDREPGALLERLPKKHDAQQPGALARSYPSTDACRRFVDTRASGLLARPPSPWPLPPEPDLVRSTLTLLQRNLVLKSRDLFFLVLTLAVPVVVSALFHAVMGAQLDARSKSFEAAVLEHKYFVVLTIMGCFFGALSAALEIVTELPILRRERRGGVPLGAYVASKALTFVIPALIFPALALGTLHLLSDEVMRGSPIEQWSVLAPAFLAAACAGLWLSSLLRSAQGVVVVAVFYAILQLIFSVFVPLHVTSDDRPRAEWLSVASAPTTARWALAGLVTTTDLCALDTALPDRPIEALASGHPVRMAAFALDCPVSMYRDHGIRRADTAERRTDAAPRRESIVANLVLATFALLGAAHRLRDRSIGTQ